MAPLTRGRCDEQAAAPGAHHALYYSQRASAGLIISEGTLVSQQVSAHEDAEIFPPEIFALLVSEHGHCACKL